MADARNHPRLRALALGAAGPERDWIADPDARVLERRAGFERHPEQRAPTGSGVRVFDRQPLERQAARHALGEVDRLARLSIRFARRLTFASPQLGELGQRGHRVGLLHAREPSAELYSPPMNDELTHLDEQGRARMVDVGDKAVTRRLAVARGRVVMQAETLALLLSGGAPKGDVLAVARVAGIQAAKKTPELIPLCHAFN